MAAEATVLSLLSDTPLQTLLWQERGPFSYICRVNVLVSVSLQTCGVAAWVICDCFLCVSVAWGKFSFLLSVFPEPWLISES